MPSVMVREPAVGWLLTFLNCGGLHGDFRKSVDDPRKGTMLDC